jgi:membrane protein implicated in regulation of membrane protease activity
VPWLVAAGALGLAEVLTLRLVLGLLAIAAGLAAAVAAAGAPSALPVITFLVAAVALLAIVVPVARRHVRMPPETRTGIAALPGQQALVVQQVDGQGGRVKIRGEIWSARSYDGHQVLPVGSRADVIDIDGATALVHSLEHP